MFIKLIPAVVEDKLLRFTVFLVKSHKNCKNIQVLACGCQIGTASCKCTTKYSKKLKIYSRKI